MILLLNKFLIKYIQLKMAGNKALQKFKESKIPKKGTAKTIIEIPIYSEPNTHSSIIGRIKKIKKLLG